MTQSRRNLERMRTILRNYNEVKQVEIEAKFLEVSQNDLEEFSFDWTMRSNGEVVAQFQPRNLQDSFSVDAQSSQINVYSPVLDIDPVSVNPPERPLSIDLAEQAVSSVMRTADNAFNFGEAFDVDVMINAIARKSGSDLMSAPKVTVLSGKRAEIVVATRAPLSRKLW